MLLKTEVLCLFILFSVLRNTEGSCLEYGHSCWGAHGKRSGKTTSISNEIPKYQKDSIEATSSGSLDKVKGSKYVLLSILLDKKALNNLQEISDNPDFTYGNDIDPQADQPDSSDADQKNWTKNKSKFKTPLQKRKLFQKNPNKLMPIPMKIKYSPENINPNAYDSFDPYNYFLKSKDSEIVMDESYLNDDPNVNNQI